jgi:AcrR family transcriptional regulator
MATVDDSSAAGSRGRRRTELRRALVEKEILDRAASLFAERGYTGTSLQDVAEALGMSRTALYYYMSSKEAMLGRLVENLSARDAKALAGILERGDGDPAQQLHEMACEIARNAASNPEQTRILTENRHHLPPGQAATDRVAERSILRSIEAVIAAGIQVGEFRPVSPRPAALSIIGMCLWTAWWVSAPDTRNIEAVAQQVADQALLSVRLGATKLDRADAGALIGAVHEQLDQLERVLGD